MDYEEFLGTKIVNIDISGFDVADADIHPLLFDWQAAIVKQALKQGKYALFEECGAGKTLQLSEWSKHVQRRTGGYVLIVSPLAVAYQTILEAAKIDLEVKYIRYHADAGTPGVYITNYDMLKEFDGSLWDGVVIDESGILKSFTGATKRLILNMFESTPYKLACTATPAPNDHLELGNHAEFLNVMKSNEMIQRWFINDSMQAGNYRLKKHAEKDFWCWITSWSVCLSKPSDLGYPDVCERYTFDMPALIVHDEIVGVDHSRAWKDGHMFVDGTLSATDMWREKAATLKDRCARAKEIVDNSGESDNYWVVWCDTNNEADELVRLFPKAIEVRGSESIKEKERKLKLFSDGEVKMIISKAGIAGWGLNWQHCHNMIFVGVTFSFESNYQAMRRTWRFGQVNDVHVYMIAAESEGDIMKTLSAKEAAHKEMQQSMNEAMKEHGFAITDKRSSYRHIENMNMQIPAWLRTQS